MVDDELHIAYVIHYKLDIFTHMKLWEVCLIDWVLVARFLHNERGSLTVSMSGKIVTVES